MRPLNTMLLHSNIYMSLVTRPVVADPRGGTPGARPPHGPKFFKFHAVFGKIQLICMLALPLGVGAPSYGGILYPPLATSLYLVMSNVSKYSESQYHKIKLLHIVSFISMNFKVGLTLN